MRPCLMAATCDARSSSCSRLLTGFVSVSRERARDCATPRWAAQSHGFFARTLSLLAVSYVSPHPDAKVQLDPRTKRKRERMEAKRFEVVLAEQVLDIRVDIDSRGDLMAAAGFYEPCLQHIRHVVRELIMK